MSSEQKKHFLEVSVCVRVLEKQNADDYHGRLIDGHKTSGWILCEKQIQTQAFYINRLKEMVSEYTAKYRLLPDNPREEEALWEYGGYYEDEPEEAKNGL